MAKLTIVPGPTFGFTPNTTSLRYLDGEMTELAMKLHAQMLADESPRYIPSDDYETLVIVDSAAALYREIYGTDYVGFDGCTLDAEIDAAIASLADFHGAGSTGVI